MIIVVEGPSAAGKSTWASQWGRERLVPESARVDAPVNAGCRAMAEFSVELNCVRWAEARAIERSSAIAICDADPLKLHYDYCLARVGAGALALRHRSVRRVDANAPGPPG